MATTNTPNMSLIVPGVGSEAGPDYALEINNDLSILDQHDHSSGKGVSITPAGLNINSALTFNSQFAIDLAGITMVAQSSPPTLNSVYVAGTDLYFVDGVGNNVRITQSGGVAGAPGSISNLTSPASAAYISGSQTFVWQSGANIAANMDFGAAVLRNLSPNSTYSLTLQPPTLSSNYTITLPTLPAVNSFAAINNLGAMTATVPVSGGITTANINSSANILGSQLDPAANILGTQLAANANVLRTQLYTIGQQISASSGNFTADTNSGSGYVDVTNLSLSITTTGRPVMIMFIPDGVQLASIGGIGNNNNALFRILRDATVIASSQVSVSGPSIPAIVPPGVLNMLDTPAAGTYTYKLQAIRSGAPAATAVSNVKMVVYEL